MKTQKKMSERLKNLYPSLQNISGKAIVSHNVHEEHNENLKQKHINEAKTTFLNLKKNIDIFCNSDDITKKAAALHSIYVNAQYITLFRYLFDDNFFQHLHQSAFEDSGSFRLTTEAFAMLSYILLNCPWAKDIFTEHDFVETSTQILLSQKNSVRPEIISSFIVNYIRKFEKVIPYEIFEFYQTYFQKAKFVNDKIWILESLLGIVSAPHFKQDESIEDLLQFTKEALIQSREEDIGILIAEQIIYIYAALYSSEISDGNKALILDDTVIESIYEMYDPSNESLANAVLTFLINVLFYDISLLNYFLPNSFYENILQSYTAIGDKPKLKQKIVHFANSSVNFGSEAMKYIQSTHFIQFVSEEYDKFPFYLQLEAISFFCKILINVQDSDVEQILELISFDIFVDHIISNNNEIISMILIFLLHLLDNIEKAPDVFRAGMHNLFDDALLDRLLEISNCENPKFAICAKTIYSRISSLKE